MKIWKEIEKDILRFLEGNLMRKKDILTDREGKKKFQSGTTAGFMTGGRQIEKSLRADMYVQRSEERRFRKSNANLFYIQVICT